MTEPTTGGHAGKRARVARSADFKHFLRTSWRLFRPYWRSDHKKEAWLYLAGILVVTLMMTGFSVAISFAIAKFFTALEQKNINDFINGLLWMGGAIGFLVVLTILNTQLKLGLQIRWRRWLTNQYFDRYFDRLGYYQLELGDYDIDNPDQRISEDIRNFTTETTELGLELFKAFLTLFSFVVVLWSISGPLELTVFGVDLEIPGYMVWVAILYSIIGTWLGHVIAHPLGKLNFELQANEADLRFSLVRIRENAEGVALANGIGHESRQLRRLLDRVVDVWLSIIKYTKRLHGYRAFFSQMDFFFPIMAASPRFFSGAIEFGVLMQTAAAFQQVENSLSWFLNSYERLAKWKSSVDRLLTLDSAMAEALQDRVASLIELSTLQGRGEIEVDGLSIWLPDGRRLLTDCDIEFENGVNVMISGRSGTGKSTFFRAMAGLWPWGDGRIHVPIHSVFLSQRPYLPLGSLGSTICYPEPDGSFERSRIVNLLELCDMHEFADRLDEVSDWSKVLSAGEQQRIAIVRAILKSPGQLFLDEATAALDAETEAKVYGMLRAKLPDCTVISIAHRESIGRYHERHIVLDAGAKSLAEAPAA